MRLSGEPTYSVSLIISPTSLRPAFRARLSSHTGGMYLDSLSRVAVYGLEAALLYALNVERYQVECVGCSK